MAAVGAGLDVDVPRGRMVVDCGGGTTEVVVISLGSICISNTVRIGGESLDEALLDHLCLKYRFQIGMSTAERLKLELAEALGSDGGRQRTISMKGYNLASSRPESLSLSADELAKVYERHLQAIVNIVRLALQRTPPELLQDIFDDGLILTGGAAMAGLLKQRVAEATGLAVRMADAPLDCVALGLEQMLEGGERRTSLEI
jgi:rod shape-determining protein MreB